MPFEVDFLPVGDSYGDAIVVRYGNDVSGYWLHVVDGGTTDTGDTVIQHIETHYPGYHINHIVLSHADNDHACGLIKILKRFKVQNLWMNRPWLYAGEVLHKFHGNFTLQGLVDDMRSRHPFLVELEGLAHAQGTSIHEAFQGDQIGRKCPDFCVLRRVEKTSSGSGFCRSAFPLSVFRGARGAEPPASHRLAC